MDVGKINLSFLAKTAVDKAPKAWVQSGVFGFEMLRSIAFLSQNLALFALAEKPEGKDRREFGRHTKMLFRDLSELLKKDAKHIADGTYPASVLVTESPQTFLKRYPKILWDSLAVSRRRLLRRSNDFSVEAHEYLREVPEYFRRNYHFQTGGYLTQKSAELYEHQVEILFSGAADAMRRLILPPLKKAFPHSQGEGLHFLEVAAGTGRLTRFVKLTFPKAKITVMDVSHPYLKKAQENLSGFTKIGFVQGDAAELPFRDQQFDAVYSCFLFHELPLEVRRQVVSEGFRVLKPGGFYGMVDSVQSEDKSDFDWALKQFPVDFHEPFFKNYLQNPMEGLLKHSGFERPETEIGFFSKVVSAVKTPSQDPTENPA